MYIRTNDVDDPLPCISPQLPVLIHELLAVEIWREKVFPLMLEKSSRPKTSFPAYLVVSTCIDTKSNTVIHVPYLIAADWSYNYVHVHD